jgi:MFS family permease
MAAAACGLARNFWHLLFARIGVGAGEAALMPASYSLIGDSFPPQRRALAMSMFTVGAGIGAAASLFIGGVLIHEVPKDGVTLPFVGTLVGWQIVFLLTGIPGVLISWLVFTLRDPGRRNLTSDNSSPREALQYLMRHKRLFICHFFGFPLLAMPSWGMAAWTAAHFYRNFGWTPMEVGSALALINITVCTTGAAMLGYIADRWFQAERTDAHIRMFLYVGVIQLVAVVSGISSNNPWGVLTGIAVMLSCSPMNGVAVAALHLITPNQYRGQITAIYLLIYSVICLGIGPSVVAAITDFVFADNKMVGWSMALTFALAFPFSMTLLYLALRPFREKLAADGAL